MLQDLLLLHHLQLLLTHLRHICSHLGRVELGRTLALHLTGHTTHNCILHPLEGHDVFVKVLICLDHVWMCPSGCLLSLVLVVDLTLVLLRFVHSFLALA